MYKQTIWITGASGGIGSALMKELSARAYVGNYKIIDTDIDVDVTDLEQVKQAVDIYKPTLIINCAAISNRERCEEDKVAAYKVNALGARNLASESRRVNAKIIHLSTDDVFDANLTGAKNEFDTPVCNSVYGKSKLAGENFVRELNAKHMIIRSSWVYGMSDHDFFSEIEALGKAGKEIVVPMGEISTPTPVTKLAELIEVLIDSNEYGIYHASCEGTCSRKEFAVAILRALGYDPTLVKGSFDNGASQKSTLLENLMLQMTGLYEMPHWRDAFEEYIATLNRK